MKKKKMLNKTFSNKLEIIPEKNEKDITQPIDSFNDFVIIEKKDKIKETSLKQNEKIESENNILKDFVVLQRRPKQAQEQSRFFQFFKELAEKEKEKEKQKLKDEPKIEKIEQNELKENDLNIQPQNQRFDSSDSSSSYFSISQYQNPKCENNNININNINERKSIKSINSNFTFSNLASRSTSDSGFTGHGGSFSNKPTENNFNNFPSNNNFYNTNSINSIENNIITNNLNNLNNIQNNNNNSNNNNVINIYPGNVRNKINMFNNILIEKNFEPKINMKKVLSFEDKRSTLMIKNIPNKFTTEKLLEFIDINFKGTYDLFILPKDGNKNRNFGYSFINFISSYYIPFFYHEFNGKKWKDTNSLKICEITYSKYQGRSELITHYPNKIIFFNDVNKSNKDGFFFIPSEYKLLFKQLFPKQPIEEKNYGFITKIPFKN